MKEKIRSILVELGYLMTALLTKKKIGRIFLDGVIQGLMSANHVVEHKGVKLKFATPNSLNYFRVSSFSSKEPETLEWIDGIPEGKILWDIGANVGLYSVYAAKARNLIVYAFEPSVFNLELLSRNIFINNLTDKVTIFSFPLSDQLKRSTLNLTTLEWGGALSTFDKNYGFDGQELQKVFEQPVIGMSMNDAVNRLGLSCPDYIKLDVDGIEQLILSGGRDVLERVSGILVEVNDDFSEQAEQVSRLLKESGLIFKEKRHGEMFNNNQRFGMLYNQIWIRPV
ncbi:FkbM family methyltransferase [Alphaproteobacteria bacterium LSUCC0744]